MDVDKLKKWLDMAQQFQGDNFWSDIFNEEITGMTPHSSKNKKKQEDSKPSSPPFPLVDILVNEKQLIILVDLPGVSKEDVELAIIGNELHLRGVSRSSFPSMEIIQSERMSGSFQRVIPLAVPVDETSVAARYYLGILEVRFERLVPSKKDITID